MRSAVEIIRHMWTDPHMAFDATMASGAISAPYWFELLPKILHAYVAILGAVLITLRVALSLREWRLKGVKDDE